MFNFYLISCFDSPRQNWFVFLNLLLVVVISWCSGLTILVGLFLCLDFGPLWNQGFSFLRIVWLNPLQFGLALYCVTFVFLWPAFLLCLFTFCFGACFLVWALCYLLLFPFCLSTLVLSDVLYCFWLWLVFVFSLVFILGFQGLLMLCFGWLEFSFCLFVWVLFFNDWSNVVHVIRCVILLSVAVWIRLIWLLLRGLVVESIFFGLFSPFLVAGSWLLLFRHWNNGVE